MDNRLRSLLFGAGLSLVPILSAEAEDLCATLAVPGGIDLACSTDPEGERAVVAPEEDLFGPATRLTLWRVDEPVEDMDAWLRRQVTVDLSSVSQAMRALTTSEDSPFASPRFEDVITSLAETVQDWGDLPLQGCGEPEALEDEAGRELSCTWTTGPLAQYMTVRLVRTPDATFALSLRAMNETRMGHLVAIANSFRPEDRT